MNTRIKELTEQAVRNVESTNSYHSMVFDKEKFAELIVREHIQLLKQEWYTLNNDADFDARDNSQGELRFRAGQKAEVVVLIEKIKKHFGIE